MRVNFAAGSFEKPRSQNRVTKSMQNIQWSGEGEGVILLLTTVVTVDEMVNSKITHSIKSNIVDF